jgi:hypothetical protein
MTMGNSHRFRVKSELFDNFEKDVRELKNGKGQSADGRTKSNMEPYIYQNIWDFSILAKRAPFSIVMSLSLLDGRGSFRNNGDCKTKNSDRLGGRELWLKSRDLTSTKSQPTSAT